MEGVLADFLAEALKADVLMLVRTSSQELEMVVNHCTLIEGPLRRLELEALLYAGVLRVRTICKTFNGDFEFGGL